MREKDSWNADQEDARGRKSHGGDVLDVVRQLYLPGAATFMHDSAPMAARGSGIEVPDDCTFSQRGV
jgi:hypothetical protein